MITTAEGRRIEVRRDALVEEIRFDERFGKGNVLEFDDGKKELIIYIGAVSFGTLRRGKNGTLDEMAYDTGDTFDNQPNCVYEEGTSNYNELNNKLLGAKL